MLAVSCGNREFNASSPGVDNSCPSFGDVGIGQWPTPTQTLVLRNLGGVALTLNSVSVAISGSAAFSQVGALAGTEIDPANVQGYNTRDLVIQFAPTGLGAFSAQVTIAYDTNFQLSFFVSGVGKHGTR